MLLFTKGEVLRCRAGKRYEVTRNIYAAEPCAYDDLAPMDGQDSFKPHDPIPAWYWDALRKRFKELGHVEFQEKA